MALLLSSLAAVVYAIYFSPLLSLKSIKVEGVHYLTSAEVLQAANLNLGESLALVNSEDISQSVGKLPEVANVEIRRVVPHSVIIVVAERNPVARIQIGQEWKLVDRAGVVFGFDSSTTGELLQIEAKTDALRGVCVSVLRYLPTWLAGKVKVVTAQSRDSAVIQLQDDREIVIGSAEKLKLKFKVLQRLMQIDGKGFDVSSPEFATVKK